MPLARSGETTFTTTLRPSATSSATKTRLMPPPFNSCSSVYAVPNVAPRCFLSSVVTAYTPEPGGQRLKTRGGPNITYARRAPGKPAAGGKVASLLGVRLRYRGALGPAGRAVAPTGSVLVARTPPAGLRAPRSTRRTRPT